MSERIDLHLHTDRADEHFQMTVLRTLDSIIKSHSEFRDSVTRKLDDILTRLINIKIQENQMATSIEDIEQFVSDIDTETNGIAARLDRNTATIEALKKQVADGSPVTQDQLDQLGNALTPISARLRALGSDPSDPLPVDPNPEDPPVSNQ